MAAAKRKRPADLEAYDLWALSYEALLRGTEADLEQALAYADAAIAKDPGLVRAYTKKAWILTRSGPSTGTTGPEPSPRWSAWRGPRSASIPTTRRHTWSSPSPTHLERAVGGSEAATARALELNPSSADILNLAAAQHGRTSASRSAAPRCATGPSG